MADVETLHSVTCRPFMDCVSVFLMKYDVEIFFIRICFFFLLANNVAVPEFASSESGSHQQLALCMWWTPVLTPEHSGGRQGMFAMLSSLRCENANK